jgi:hypothetical protein
MLKKLLSLVVLGYSAVSAMATESPTLFQEPTNEANFMLQQWVDEYRAGMFAPDDIAEYRFALIDEATLDAIRSGHTDRLVFNFSDTFSYSMTIREIQRRKLIGIFPPRQIRTSIPF